jgi:hypothetical protein
VIGDGVHSARLLTIRELGAALRHPGVVIGDWRDEWDGLQVLQGRLEEIYEGRAGGSVEARTDLLNFFERSEALRDHAKLALDGTSVRSKIDTVMRAQRPLAIAHDLAIKIKHGKQDEPPWAGNVGGDLVSQSVTVYVGTGTSAHYWEIAFTPTGAGTNGDVTVDALALSREVVVAWRSLLVDVALLD